MKIYFCLGSGHRFSGAISRDQLIALVRTALSWCTTSLNALLAVTLLALVSMLSTPSAAAQEQTARPSSQRTSEPKQTEPKQENKQAAPEHKGAAGQLVEEAREAETPGLSVSGNWLEGWASQNNFQASRARLLDFLPVKFVKLLNG